jgi:hypothetical protein
VPVYPKNHRNHALTVAQRKHWHKWFTKEEFTNNRKGIIEFNFNVEGSK